MTNSFPLGPFDLVTPLGEGGMGEIWRGVHRKEGLPVAVKFLRRDRLESHRGELEREVRAHAGLNHPGIMVLFDFATVTEGDALASNGRLIAGSPYIAMELADRGSLRDHMPVESWSQVHGIITPLLGALAHAHAREVIHRDIKPENILLFGARPYVAKLSDFGIAHAKSSEHESSPAELASFAGTVHYSAPEQLLGQWRLFGPWTDIYALGCVVWELVCGAPPFDGHWTEVAHRHIEGALPPFCPRIPVPDSLRAWLGHALARNPMERFGTCSDAWHGLPDPVLPGVIEETLPIIQALPWLPTLEIDTKATEQTVLSEDADVETDTSTQILETLRLDAEVGHRVLQRAPITVAVPDDWRYPALRDDYPNLSGTGLGLFGLREPRFIGRERERDLIWRELRRVAEAGGVRVVFIMGGPGIGKSSLASWIAMRADETGAARRLEARNTPDASGQADGFPGLLRRGFRAWNLTGDELFEHLMPQLNFPDAESLDERDARLLAGYLGAGDTPKSYPFPNPDTRNALAHRLLCGFTAERPTVVWLDDLQWSSDLMETVSYLLEVNAQPNALFIATVRSDLLANDPKRQRQLAPLLESPRATKIDLAALSTADEASLVREFLPIDDALAARVAERAEGNPLFARQLLRWLVDRATDIDGMIRLTEQLDHALPETIQELFNERVDDFLTSFGADPAITERAIEVAAALGRQFDREEWAAALRMQSIDIPSGLDKELVVRGLTRETPAGLEFEHILLVDSLRNRATRSGRLEHHHGCCARALQQRAQGDLDTEIRAMDHFAKAGEWENALEISMAVANPLARRGNMNSLRELLDRRLDWQKRAAYTDSDERRLKTLLQVGILSAERPSSGDLSPQAIADHVLREARAHGHAALEMQSLELLAMVSEREGRFQDACHYSTLALVAARQLGQSRAECVSLVRIGWAHTYAGQVDDAKSTFSAAYELARAQDDLYLRSYALIGKNWVALVSGELERSRRFEEELLDSASQEDWPILEMYGLCSRASRHLLTGDFELALADARDAQSAKNRAQTTSEDGLLFSLQGLAFVLTEHVDDAAICLETLNGKRRNELPSQRAYRIALEFAVAAARRKLDDFDAAAEWLLGAKIESAVVRPEYPAIAEWVAQRWSTIDSERARLSLDVAERMRQRLGSAT